MGQEALKRERNEYTSLLKLHAVHHVDQSQ